MDAGAGPYLWLRTGFWDEAVILDGIARLLAASGDRERLAATSGDARLLVIGSIIARSGIRLCVFDDAWNPSALHAVLSAMPAGDEIDALVQPNQPASLLWTNAPTLLRDRLTNGVLVRLFYGYFADNTKLLAKREGKVRDEFERTRVDLDFDTLFTDWKNQSQPPIVVPVGAAGNGLDFDPNPDSAEADRALRLDFPFAPALWDSVISVTATVSKGSGGDRAWYANSGEVKIEGHTEYETTVDGEKKTYVLHGTSFAAPRLSQREALYLLTGGTSSCDNYVPPLGYTDVDVGDPEWQNLLLKDAVPSYCKNFDNQARVQSQPLANQTT